MGRTWSGRRGSNSRHSAWKADALPTELHPLDLVEGEGFEPSKHKCGRFTVCSLWPLGYPSTTRFLLPARARPGLACFLPRRHAWSWRWDSNPQPADYKSAALPIELRQPKRALCSYMRASSRIVRARSQAVAAQRQRKSNARAFLPGHPVATAAVAGRRLRTAQWRRPLRH